MKKALLIFVVAVTLSPLTAFAAEFRFSENPSIGSQERIIGDIYIGGGNVTSAGTVTGDIVVGGGTVVISGIVGADIIAGGGNITILSPVADDIRVGGGSIVIQSRVGGDVVVGGGQVTIGGTGIGGDVVVGGGSVRIDAPVAGNVRGGGGNVFLNSPIAGDVNIEADTLTLGSQAVISGNLTYKAKKELTKEAGAIVRGETKFEERIWKKAPKAAVAGILSLIVLGKFLALLVSSLIIGLVFSRFSKEIIAKVVDRPLMEIGRGLITFAALPVISIIAMVTLIGIPIGVLGIVGFVALIIASWIVTPIIVGSAVYKYFSKGDWEISWKTILIGALVFCLLGFVPFVGGLVQCLLMLFSLGAIVAIKLSVAKEWR